MRDPERIKVVLGKLEKAWTRYPDLRLGQLMENVMTLHLERINRQNADAFYIEDNVWIDAIDNFLLDT